MASSTPVKVEMRDSRVFVIFEQSMGDFGGQYPAAEPQQLLTGIPGFEVPPDWLQTPEYLVTLPDWQFPLNGPVTCRRCDEVAYYATTCLLYTSPSPRDGLLSRMPSSA